MKTETVIDILSREVIADIRSAAWLESEIHPECNLHQRHEIADICEKDNIERVWRVLGICAAEVMMVLRRLLLPDRMCRFHDNLERPDSWQFVFRHRLPPQVGNFFKEKIHEFMVARVMAERLAVLIPPAAACWKERADSILLSLRTESAASTTLSQVFRPLSPI